MENLHTEDTFDLRPLLLKIKDNWYYFVVSVVLLLVLAFFYAQYSQREYKVNSTVILENKDIGSSSANELLSGNSDRNSEGGTTVSLSNEISKLTSFNLLEDAMNRLDFNVSYYTVEKFWPKFVRNSWLNEQYGNFPFQIVPDSSGMQAINLPIYVEVLADNQVRVTASGEDVSVVNYSTGRGTVVSEINIDQVLNVNESFSSDFLNFKLKPNQNGVIDQTVDMCFILHRNSDLVGRYKANLTVEPVETQDKNAGTLSLLLTDNVARKGQVFLNTLITTYADEQLAKKNQKGVNSINFLDKQITGIGDSLKAAQLALQTFKTANNIVDINYSKSSVIDQLGKLDQERLGLEDKLSYYRNTLSYLRSEGSSRIIAPAAAGINDPVFNDLIPKYIDLYTKYESLKNNAREGNPLLSQREAEMDNLKEVLIENLSNSISAISGNLSSVNQRTNRLSSDIKTLPQDERRLADLERGYEYYMQKYNYLVDKRAEAELSLATNIANVDVIDDARILGGKPSWPNAGLIYAVAILIGLMMPLAFILLKDTANNKITDKIELEKRTQLPLLGLISSGMKDSKIVSRQYPNSAVSESFKFARINLQYFHHSEGSQVIGITSSVSGEGKTFCSSNLAASFAESGKKTLLIGGDMRKPKMTEYFNVHETGLADLLEGQASLENVIQPTNIKNLHVIAPGIIHSDPVQLFENAHMDRLMAELKLRYDTIIVDTPPIAYVADYFVLLKYFDVNVFVVRFNYTDKNALNGIKDLGKNSKIKNLNLLFNDVKRTSAYGYGYLDSDHGYYNKNESEDISQKVKFKKLFS